MQHGHKKQVQQTYRHDAENPFDFIATLFLLGSGFNSLFPFVQWGYLVFTWSSRYDFEAGMQGVRGVSSDVVQQCWLVKVDATAQGT